MKRFQLFLVGVFVAAGPLFAQSADADWHSEVAKIKELIQANPTQTSEETAQLLRGKSKESIDLLTTIGQVYLKAGKISEAGTYTALGQEAGSKSAAVSMLQGDMTIAKKEAGEACQLYEQAIYFDPSYKEAYLKFADVYKAANPQLATEELKQLKSIDPLSVAANKKLAEIYYLNNKFDKAAEAYVRFINTPEATEDDLTKYLFVLFLDHDSEKSLQIVLMGLQKDPRDTAFDRSAMYNYTDLERYDEAMRATDAFFKESDKTDFSYLDYMYFGHLLNAVKKHDQAVDAYMQAITPDPGKADLWREASSSYGLNSKFTKAIEAYKRYSESLSADKRTPDVQFQIGKFYYEEGAQSDTLTVPLDKRRAALLSVDSIFTEIATVALDSYLGSFWRACIDSVLDPEATQELAKPYYGEVATFLVDKNDPRYNSALIECYSHLGYYYLVANKLPKSKEFWNRILAIDPTNATTKRTLDGIKQQ